MDGSLDEIWNIPTTPRSPSRENEQQSGQPLFLRGSDDENDEMPDAPPRRTDPQVDIEALFSGVDDLPEGPGDGSRAPALTPHQILSSSPAHHLDDGDNGQGEKDKDAKKPKKKIMRLDEGRLIGDSGFPQLMQDTKNVKIKGKGHEASDLNRLLQVYQFWTHRLYPKTPFKDTVDRVEKLCHSKRMHNNLSEWRDIAHGIVNGNKAGEDEEDGGIIDLTDPSSVPGPDSDSAPGPDSDQADYASSSSHAATRPPSSVDYNESDLDMDMAAMDATAKLNAQQVMGRRQTEPVTSKEDDAAILNSLSAASSAAADDDEEAWLQAEAAEAVQARSRVPVPDDDNEMWDEVDRMSEPATNTATSIAKHAPDNQDDEWDALNDMEDTTSGSASRVVSSVEEDYADMYMDGS